MFRPYLTGRRLVCALTLGVATTGPLHAVDDAGLDYFSELPLVLTPSRMPQTLNRAPAAMTVIEADLIHAAGYRDLPRILRLVPGMQVGQERNGNHWVTYHGLGNDNPSEMQVLVDGRSVLSPAAFGGVDWSVLPVTPDEIERIEVVRGTDSIAHGTNAFLGVVNIITRPATEAPSGQITIQKGNAGITDLHAEMTRRIRNGGLRVATGVLRDEGFAGLHDGHRQARLSARSDWQPSAEDSVMVRIGVSEGSRGLGYPDSMFGNNAERDSRYHHHSLQAHWRHDVSAREEWRVGVHHSGDRTTDHWTASAVRIDLATPRTATVPLDRNRTATRSGIEAQHRLATSDTLQTVWGGELRHDRIDAPFFFYGQGNRESTLGRVFANLEWQPAAAWSLNAGTLAEHQEGERTRLAPRLFTNWAVSPNNTLRAGVSRAWRHRNLFELYGDIRAVDPVDGRVLARPYVPNPNLRTTRIDAKELGYLAYWPKVRTTLDVRLFNERITDFVVRESQPPTPENPLLAGFIPATRYTNLETPLTLRGVETQWHLDPRPESRILFSHTMIDRRSSDPAIADRAAPYSASLSWMQRWGHGWESMISVLRMGPLAGGDGFVPGVRYTAPAYTTVDLRIARHTQIGILPLEVALTATNLGGRHQEIADRSEQVLHPEGPANRVSRMVWLGITLSTP